MKRIAKRRLSCLLSAILLLVMSLDMSAFAGVFEKTARKIDVWDFGKKLFEGGRQPLDGSA